MASLEERARGSRGRVRGRPPTVRVRRTEIGLEKLCVRCDDWWPLDDAFERNPSGAFGRANRCIACRNINRNARREIDPSYGRGRPMMVAGILPGTIAPTSGAHKGVPMHPDSAAARALKEARRAKSKKKPRTMPQQNRGESRQDYGTPLDFVRACERRFGSITWDLAANEHNAVCDLWIGEEQNSLSVRWSDLGNGLLWLNPPYESIAPWARKCASEAALGARVLFLVPAAVGSNWYWENVANNALVLCISPRLVFRGETDPYVKDLILCAFGFGRVGFERWIWKRRSR